MTTNNISPLDIADFSLVHIHEGTPHCIKHGAMNKVAKHEDGGGLWRCITVHGMKPIVNGNSISYKTVDCVCRAGCVEKRDINE